MAFEIKLFQNDEFEIRSVLGEDGEPRWVAADACKAMGISIDKDGNSNPSDALRRVASEDKGLVLIQTIKGAQKLTCVNESGLYALILGARRRESKPQIARFKRWVTSEVLPSIRKTGRYVSPAADPELDALDPRLAVIKQLYDIVARQVETENRLTEAEANAEKALREAKRAQQAADEALSTLKDDTKYMSLVGYSASRKLGLSGQGFSAAGIRLSKYCRDNGIPIRRAPCEVWGQKNLYPVEVLDSYFVKVSP